MFSLHCRISRLENTETRIPKTWPTRVAQSTRSCLECLLTSTWHRVEEVSPLWLNHVLPFFLITWKRKVCFESQDRRPKSSGSRVVSKQESMTWLIESEILMQSQELWSLTLESYLILFWLTVCTRIGWCLRGECLLHHTNSIMESKCCKLG